MVVVWWWCSDGGGGGGGVVVVQRGYSGGTDGVQWGTVGVQ